MIEGGGWNLLLSSFTREESWISVRSMGNVQRTLTFCNEVKPSLPKKNSTFFILGIDNMIAMVYDVIKIKDKENLK